MVRFRNIRVRMKGGKSRIQRAMVLASGKLRFVKNLSRSRSTAPRHKTTKHRSVRNTTKKNRRSGTSTVRSVEKIVKIGALLAPAAQAAFASASRDDKLGVISSRYTGFDTRDGSFHLGRLLEGWGPYVGVEVGTRLAHKVIGLIRRL